MSPEHMIVDYECGLVYMRMGVCTPVPLCICVCAAVHAHTCARHACMVSFKHAFAALRENRGIPVGDEHVRGGRVCASSDHIALTPILGYILSPFS